jgi:hypothetical protein
MLSAIKLFEQRRCEAAFWDSVSLPDRSWTICDLLYGLPFRSFSEGVSTNHTALSIFYGVETCIEWETCN